MQKLHLSRRDRRLRPAYALRVGGVRKSSDRELAILESKSKGDLRFQARIAP